MNTTLYISTATVLLLAIAGTATADSYSGTLLVGHPVTGALGGVNEIATPCDTGSPLGGTDGTWFDISGDAGTSFELTMDATLDADVWFYTADCGFISDAVGAVEGLGTTESGAVPDGAAYAIVDAYLGTGAFTLTLS